MTRSLWYAIHTRSRHEFVVQSELLKKNYEVFLPTVDKLRKWKDRKKIVTFPLFPGYLFVKFEATKENMIDILKTRGVSNILGTSPLQPINVPDEQIENLRKVVLSKCEVDPYPYLKEGEVIRIKKGILEGVTGILVKKEDFHRLVICVDLLQRAVSIKLDATDVEPV